MTLKLICVTRNHAKTTARVKYVKGVILAFAPHTLQVRIHIDKKQFFKCNNFKG